MNEFPEAPDPFAPIKCNLEPEWLSNMVGGVSAEMQRRRMVLLMIGPLFIGPLLLLGSLGLPSPSLPIHIRIWRGKKSILHLS